MQNNHPSQKIRLLLVDDHIVLRMGLVTATSGEADMEVVGEADNASEALEAYRTLRPDIVVLDLRMPGVSGFDTIRLLRDEFPEARILIFSNYASGEEALQAFRLGASGFVVKDMPLERLLEAIRRIHQGEQFVPGEIATRMNGRILSRLSPRELEVLRLIAKGLSNKEIASALNLVEGTIKVHVTSILGKLRVPDRTRAIVVGVKQGIIQME